MKTHNHSPAPSIGHRPRPMHIAAATSFAAILAMGFAFMVGGSTPASAKPSNDVQATFASQLQTILEKHRLAGAVVIVASKDRVLSEQAVGWSDIATRKRMEPGTMFWIASTGKTITATALMMLVDEGKVGLDDPVEKYLPIFKDQMVVKSKDKEQVILEKPIRPITIRDVLSHTSGLVKWLPEQGRFDTLPLSEKVREYALIPLSFQPGSNFEYTNAGPDTAARIIEIVSGLTFPKFLQQRLFTPLGMSDTTFWPNERQLARLATTYKEKGKTELEATPIIALSHPLSDTKRNYFGGGGLFATAHDISVFGQMILNEGVWNGKRYLSAAAVREMTSTQTDKMRIGRKQDGGYAGMRGYGLGWRTDPDNASGVFGHGGAYDTELDIDPKHGLVMVFMAQKFNMQGYVGMRNDFIDNVEADFSDHLNMAPAESRTKGVAAPISGVANSVPVSQVPQTEAKTEQQNATPPGFTAHRGLVYASPGGAPLELDLFVPSSSEGPFPLIVWIHGGGWRIGNRNGCPPLLWGRHDYALASIDYRLSSVAKFPAQIEDCKAAIRWLRANAGQYHINPQKVGVWGSSAGGHLVALLGTAGKDRRFDVGDKLEESSEVQAVCDFFGPTDLVAYAYPDFTTQLMGGRIQDFPEKYVFASPLAYVSSKAPPFFILHGRKDPLVPPIQSQLLYEALQRFKVKSWLHYVPESHGGSFVWTKETNALVQGFFDDILLGRGAFSGDKKAEEHEN